MASASSFRLVEADVSRLLDRSTQQERDALADEIAFRLDSDDQHLDVDFMKHVLALLTGTALLESHPLQKAPNTSLALPGASMTRVEERLLQELVQRGLDEGEQVFKSGGKDFVRPEPSRYGPSPSFAPRFPRFFNKIQYGVVWNKYAQTHYDEKNPPPEQVLGYKFNIFYPDLVDPSVAPRYKIERSDDDQSVLLRFTAGAPYEDAVFRIQNKEWDVDRRSGFTCQFDRGVLQLYFTFKRDKYRR
jgi:hypothetical protein